jgi:large subunit ribosomal protein L4e
MKHSAESWGTGRAVSRIPRVSGSGSGRNGQAAFGNMVRKGRMAFPVVTHRRWHRKINLRMRRHALASAVAATSVLPLIQARGHKIDKVPQLPLVLDSEVNKIQKTKEIIKVLQRFGCYEDVQRVIDGKTLRSGVSKARGKKYRIKKGPLVVVNDEGESLTRALRNIPGIDIINV